MKVSKLIEVNVDCDIINQEVYIIVVESILKYILYQFQQIPVQIDILERELNKTASSVSTAEDEFECVLEDTNTEDATDPRAFLKRKAIERRAHIIRRMRERKRKRWLTKVENIVQNFQSTLNILQKELKNGSVSSIVYAVGSTPFTPKFVLQIHLPSNPDSRYFQTSSDHSSMPRIKRKILMNLFRAFANNNEMSKFSSSHVSLTKIWTLFEKESSQCLEMANDNLCSGNVISRPEFSISPRTKVIEVFLKEKIQPVCYRVVEMELTPCVGVNKSLGNEFVKPSTQKRNKRIYSENSCTRLNIYDKNKAIKDLELSLVEPLEDGVHIIPSDEDVHMLEMPISPCVTAPGNDVKTVITQFNHKEASYFSSNYITPVLQTPCRINNFMVETPVVSNRLAEIPVILNQSPTPSPVKRLAQSITDLRFTPEMDTRCASCTSWYQVDFALCGFKEVYLSSS